MTGVALLLAVFAAVVALPPTRRVLTEDGAQDGWGAGRSARDRGRTPFRGDIAVRWRGQGHGSRRRLGGRLAPVVAVAVAVSGAVVVVTAFGASAMVWSVAAAMALATAGRVGLAHLRRRQRSRRRRQVARSARALAGRLGVGEVPAAALLGIGEDVEVLAGARRAHLMGASVPDALDRQAVVPGCEDLATLARAWRLCEVTGAPLAEATAAMARATARRAKLHATVEAELAGPRASGRLLGLLPLVGLAMAQLVGAEPMVFLTATWPGRLAVLAAVALSSVGVLWSEALAARVETEMGV